MITGKKDIILYFSLGLITGIFIISQFAFKENKEKTNKKFQTAIKQFDLPQVPDTMSFAGEPVPLHRWEVREAFDRELIYNYGFPAQISYILKLSIRFFPDIEQRLKDNGIPEDFKYLCVAESNLQNVISKAGATGFWQFMSYTGPGFNLQINHNVDDRYNVTKSTDAACIYLKQAYAKFGSWTAAAASYNCGQGAYNQQSAFQQTKYYYDLQLPDETNIGSTAIPGIKSKPVIDIGVEVTNFPASNCKIEQLKSAGYIYWDTNPDIYHQFFFKGLPRTHHLHIYPQYNEKLRKAILFRDYLISNPGEAGRYEKLKIDLAVTFYDDREQYTRSKTPFIHSVMQKIKM